MSINNVPISHLYGGDVLPDPKVAAANPYKHLTGIELELENVFQPGNLAPSWKCTEDNSLRNGLEYISNGPHAGLALRKHVADFYAAKITSKNSPRTSTHIHTNISDATIGTVRAMFIISYMMEEALYSLVNADRKFCGYCMPLSEMSPERVRNILASTNTAGFLGGLRGQNVDKYYGFNINSISKHGTVEFRYFPGGPLESDLLSWIIYCTQVKTAALQTGVDGLLGLDSPQQLENWLKEFFPEWGIKLLQATTITNLHNLLLEAISFLPEQEEAQRKETLVFINEELISLVERLILKSKHRTEILRNMTRGMGVVAINEWYDIIHQCNVLGHDEEIRMQKMELKKPIRQKPFNFDMEYARLQAMRMGLNDNNDVVNIIVDEEL